MFMSLSQIARKYAARSVMPLSGSKEQSEGGIQIFYNTAVKFWTTNVIHIWLCAL
jgi:hypothetical protein